jgi:2-oxoglutarate ferredoxin oxidoreductase subunit alpha
MQAIFRMGVPVSGKNLFPSNIQGLPTWYEIRVNKDGYTARALDYDLMVAMNAQTYARDVKEVREGGYLLYDSSWPLDPELHSRRRDVHRRAAGADVQREFPRTARAHSDEEHRLRGRADRAARISMEQSSSNCSKRNSGRKKALRESNQKALKLGYDYVRKTSPARCRSIWKRWTPTTTRF